MIAENCTYKIYADDNSNNVIINNVETSNLKTVGFRLVTSVFIGASLLNLANSNSIDFSYYSTPSYNISRTPSSVCDFFTMGKTIDLLKVENINKINKIREFDNDWNGNGAKKFSKESISTFIDIINSLCKQPKIAPTGKASLLMQYEKENKSLLAFDVDCKKVEKVYVPEGRYEFAEVEVFTNDLCQNINRCVENFYGIG